MLKTGPYYYETILDQPLAKAVERVKEALQAEPHIGLLMPCNVVVQEGPGGKTVVSAVNPEMSMRVAGNDRVEPVACEVAQKLRSVIGWL